MKNPFARFWRVLFLLFLSAAPLRAQTNFGQLAIMGLSGGELEEGLVVVVALIVCCCLPIAIIGFQLYFRHRRTKMLHETIRSMVDKGAPIPPELLTPSESAPNRSRNDFRNGLLLLGIGLGAMIFIGKVGSIIFFPGLAFVLVSLVEKRSDKRDAPPKP